MTALDDKITAAFAPTATLDAFKAPGAGAPTLIEEAEAAAQAAGESAERARSRALDPALSAPELAGARREMESAGFMRDRLSAALPRLRDRHTQLLAEEEHVRRSAVYAQVKTERDQLAKDLAAFPRLCAELVALLQRCNETDAAVQRINAALPRDEPPLLLAELVARKLPGFARVYGTDIAPLARATRLPSFTGHGVVWPPAVTTDLDPSNQLFEALHAANVRAEQAKAAKAAKERTKATTW